MWDRRERGGRGAVGSAPLPALAGRNDRQASKAGLRAAPALLISFPTRAAAPLCVVSSFTSAADNPDNGGLLDLGFLRSPQSTRPNAAA